MFWFIEHLMLMQIFLSGSQSATDMPLGFIDIQHLPGLLRQCRIHLDKALRHILMYGYDELEWFCLKLFSYLLYACPLCFL